MQVCRNVFNDHPENIPPEREHQIAELVALAIAEGEENSDV